MRFLKQKQYTDAKDFAGECESVVMIAKGQSTKHFFLLYFWRSKHTREITLDLTKFANLVNKTKIIKCRCAGDMQVWN